MSQPKEKFFTALNPEDFKEYERAYLNIAMWPGKKDPSADVIRIQITGLRNDNWETIASISLYKDAQGYREMPPRTSQTQNQASEGTVSEQKENIDDLLIETKDYKPPTPNQNNSEKEMS